MTPFDQIGKILAGELKSGCANTLVIGGLEAYSANWLANNFKDSNPGQSELARRIAASLLGYTQGDAQSRKAMLAVAMALVEQAEPSPPRRKAVSSRKANSAKDASRFSPDPTAQDLVDSPAISLVGSAYPVRSNDSEKEEESEEEAPPVISSRDARFGLDAQVNLLQGVGPQRAALLAKLGVERVRQLLDLFPRRYDDYSHLKTISELIYGEEATIKARVSVINTVQLRGRRTITNVLLVDQTGRINATFYNQRFLSKTLRPGQELLVHGRVDQYMNHISFSHPEWERWNKNSVGIQPVYPLTEGLTAKWVRDLMRKVVAYWADKVPDALPATLRARSHLIDQAKALHDIHFPPTLDKIEPARRRLAFEELMLLQMVILSQRAKWQSQPGRAIKIQPDFALVKYPLLLPFELTAAQKRVIGEIFSDLQEPEPMHRLLQGDVGSGKTVVALAAMLAVVLDGHQAAIMAPTEILAEQHFRGILHILKNDNFKLRNTPRVALLTGSVKPREKQEIQRRIGEGDLEIVIGTHALIQEAVQFRDLGLAVIDEQHRFGVNQRRVLLDRAGNPGVAPDILVMSATPIPRTLALTVYGDLDLSIIDEMPKGRIPIRTKWLEPRERERSYSFIRKLVSEGRQAFVICPLVEESEAIDAKAAVEEYERLRTEVYPDLRVGLIHGKLRPAEKDGVMQAFASGDIDVLVATSVVEVGIDVPNATVMLIEGADRFGLAQLHQFRGRIGRGEHQSYCMLLADKSGSSSDERLKVIEETQDGFRLAEQDLKLRGPGEFFGTRQSGLPDLKIARLSDVKILEEARQAAIEIFDQDPSLEAPEHQLLKERMADFWRVEGDLS